MAFWQLTYNGVTKDASAWGVSKLKRKRKSAQTSTVTFDLPALAIDATQPFNWLDQVTILRNGQQWFVGWVTQIPRIGQSNQESITYELSDAWFWLENTVFQQQWLSYGGTTGGAATTITTTQSDVILGQGLNAVSMNSGQVMMEVLIYAQYAYQMLPFPTIVQGSGIPVPPAVASPFQIGALTPSITVPYAEVRDKSCADIIRLLLKYSPSAIAWVDSTTTPPTVNIAQRESLGGTSSKTIPVFPDPTSGVTIVGDFTPKPRYDIQVPVVVAKFQKTATVNGATYSELFVDSYPAAPAGITTEAWVSQPRAWVQTVDLVGSSSTTQTVNLTCKSRPVAASDGVAVSWALGNPLFSWLKQQVQPTAGGPVIAAYDYTKIQVAYINTVIDPNDPLNLPGGNPLDVPLPDCHTLVNELVTGSVAQWMTDDQNYVSAKVLIEVWLNYTGTDPATMALFVQNPHIPQQRVAPGKGYIVKFYPCKVTNADTGPYTQLTSFTGGEAVPTGFAQYLYNEMAPLHFQGGITFKESECSDQLPLGCVFNTSDGLTSWRSMNALVTAVDEDIDNGTTPVQFGPPLMLGLNDLAELFRAQLGLIPTYKLNQRTTGVLATATQVQDPIHAADTSICGPPDPRPAVPWEPTFDPKGTGWTILLNPNSKLQNSETQGDITAISNILTPLSVNPNYTGPYGIGDLVYLEVSVTNGTQVTGAIKTASGGGMFDPTLPAWDSSGNAYLACDTANPPNQTFFRHVIGYVTADAYNRPVWYQACKDNLLISLTQRSSSGVGGDTQACILAFPITNAPTGPATP